MNKPKLVFYFPYRGVGGVSILFLRLSKVLHSYYEIYLVDYDDGYMKKNMPDKTIFICVDRPDLIPEDSIIVFQSTPIWRLPDIDKFPKSCRVLFWNLHPQNFQSNYLSVGSKKWYLTYLNKFSFLRRSKLRAFVEFLHQKKSIVFMDGENFKKTKNDLDLDLDNEVYLPIITEIPQCCSLSQVNSIKNKYLWIGRLDDFKVEILLLTLKQLNKIQNMNASFSIIGSGTEETRIKEFVQTKLSSLKVHFLGDVAVDQLDKTIMEYDIVFAMGTSALDAAKLYKPVICLDYSYRPIPETYQFHMLYENKNFNVAEEISSEHLIRGPNLKDLVCNITLNHRTEADKSYEYWMKNHSSFMIDRVVSSIDSSKCTVGNLFSAGYNRPDFVTYILNILIKKFKKAHKYTDINKI